MYNALVSNEVHIKISTHVHDHNDDDKVPCSNNSKPSGVPLDSHPHNPDGNIKRSIWPSSHHSGLRTPNRSVDSDAADVGVLSAPLRQCDIVISYVRVEAFEFACELKLELFKRGFSA